MRSPRTIQIADLISKNLTLRHNANVLFNVIRSCSEDSILIDFSGVIFISWSFAHEYLSRKQHSTKRISEINVPEVVRKMFEAVNTRTMRKAALPG